MIYIVHLFHLDQTSYCASRFRLALQSWTCPSVTCTMTITTLGFSTFQNHNCYSPILTAFVLLWNIPICMEKWPLLRTGSTLDGTRKITPCLMKSIVNFKENLKTDWMYFARLDSLVCDQNVLLWIFGPVRCIIWKKHWQRCAKSEEKQADFRRLRVVP